MSKSALAIRQLTTPHCDSRREGSVIDTVIIHSMYNPNVATPSAMESCVAILDECKVSAHYLVGRDGEVVQLVPEMMRAWHAGVSQMPDGRDSVNHFSIGIELIEEPKQSDFTEAQYRALGQLCAKILAAHPIVFILGHEDIARPVGRKTDPGETFRWSYFKECLWGAGATLSRYVFPGEKGGAESAMAGDSAAADRGYVHPEVLVTTEWVAAHYNDPKVRIVESNEDPLLYRVGHIAGAVELDWARDLNDSIMRDYVQSEAFSKLMSRLGITSESTVVLYGDRNNWWACFSFWVLKLFGHRDVRILDGGRTLWEKEKRALVLEVPKVIPTKYPLRPRNDTGIRAFREQVAQHLRAKGKLIDVRSPDEFSGKKVHMEGYPNEGAIRAGHIPGARNVPWARAVDPETGRFKSAKELRAIYQTEIGLSPAEEVLSYCRIGERSSHTWFVLTYLLGFTKVRNYDGSWTEWGNLVGAPIERS